MCFPVLWVLFLAAKLVAHVPISGEGADVYASAGGTGCGEDVAVTDSVPHGAVSAHAEACDGACPTMGDGVVAVVYEGDEFLGDEGLVTHVLVERAVPIPGVFTVGTDDDDAFFVGYLWQFGFDVYPCSCMSSVSVQQIDDGAGLGV